MTSIYLVPRKEVCNDYIYYFELRDLTQSTNRNKEKPA